MVGHFAGSAPGVEVQPHGDAAEGVERILRSAAGLDGAGVVAGQGVEFGAGDGHGVTVGASTAHTTHERRSSYVAPSSQRTVKATSRLPSGVVSPST